MQILCLTPKTFNIVQVNLNISFIIYLIITKKQILYSYDWYSYNSNKKQHFICIKLKFDIKQ